MTRRIAGNAVLAAIAAVTVALLAPASGAQEAEPAKFPEPDPATSSVDAAAPGATVPAATPPPSLPATKPATASPPSSANAPASGPTPASAGARGQASAKAARAPGNDNFVLRQALVAWDMLSKAATVCPRLGKETPRLDEMQKVAQARLHVSAKALHAAMAFEIPPVFMTDRQAAGVVANAKGCDTAAMAQWQGGARWVVDTSVQVIEGEAPANLAWPAQAALEKPVRITVAGQQRYGDTRTVLLQVSNDSATPARVALLGQQLFVGLCAKVGAEGVPVWPNYAPSQWLTIPPRFKAPVLLVLEGSCKPQPRVNVGGAIAVDMGQGVRYRRFLIRGVGQAPAPVITTPPTPAAPSPPAAMSSPTPPPASYNWLRERPVPAPVQH